MTLFHFFKHFICWNIWNKDIFSKRSLLYLFIFYKFIHFIYLFLAALGLCCCAQAFSSCGEWGLLSLAWASHCHGLSHCGARAPGVQASVVVARGLSSCGSRAQLLRGMWDLPGPGLEPVSPALAGGFSTTAPPGKSRFIFWSCISYLFNMLSHNLST